jgi:diguanylate cyclase (GGDEF)-like protein/PAS domain S-box-containing protein
MTGNKAGEKAISVPDKLKQGLFGNTINVGGVEISWDVQAGMCRFRGIPVAMMWVDSTLAGLLSGVQSMVGPERFNLALQAEGRKSVESDWLLIKSHGHFAEGFAQLNLNAKVAGWGDWQLVSHDPDRCECVFRAYNNWEGGYQKALGVCWGSGMLAGKLAGICGKLFDTNCWATQTRFVARGDPYDEFIVAPSERNLEQEIENLLCSDNATRADMAVALRKLQDTEKILRESQHSYDQLVRNIPDGIYTVQFDAGGAMSFRYVSPRFCDLLAIEAEAVLRDSHAVFARVHPHDLAGLVAANELARITLKPFRWEGRFLVHGKIRWIRLSSDPIALPDGSRVWNGVVSDITEHKQTTTALREKDVQYRMAIETAVDGFWVVDMQGCLIQVNDAYARLSGYGCDELLKLRITDLEALESSAETEARIQEVMRNGRAIFESRHRRKDGGTWPVQISATYSPVASGRIFVFITDLTARKQAEEALQLASMVYQNTSEAMLVCDASRIIAVNPAFERLTGYTLDEIRGKSPHLFLAARHDPAYHQVMWEALNTEGHWSDEAWDQRKNGEVYAKHLTINAIRNTQGQVFRYVALFTDITERKRIEELVWQQANFDPLTNLPNRRMFQDRLGQEARKLLRAEQSMALLLIDLDRFKEVNDTLGHAKGDILLIEAAQRIRHCVRETDIVARLGGDEFVIIVSELSDTTGIERIAQAIINKLAEPFTLGSESVYISASIGISLYPNDTRELDALLKNADQAMYAAKNGGRNGFHYFTPSMQELAQQRMRLISELRTAITEELFCVHYQPIVEMASGRIYKAEALVRWRHPAHGLVSPGAFIALAEETGLIVPIGDWVFMQAVQQVRRWRCVYHPSFKISVNKSPVQIRSEESASHLSWPWYLQQQGVEGGSIIIEITEGLLLNTGTHVNANLLQLQNAGIQIAIDDFGTGYSSLAYLKKFDIDYLKIDQSFVRNLGTDPDDLALCEAIIMMAHKLGLKVIAEGVETAEQRDLLAAAGCDFAQGYLFSPPVPPGEFEELLGIRGEGSPNALPEPALGNERNAGLGGNGP